MGFFKRLKNVVEAKANKAIEKHEDPIEMLELSINKKEKLLQDAKKQCANFIASVDNIRNEKKQEIKFKIEELELEISKMKSKKQELATRLDVAEINNEINETLSGLSDDHGINLDELEKKVQQKESYGKALEGMKPKNEDSMLDDYINNSPVVDSKVEDELERIKREMNK